MKTVVVISSAINHPYELLASIRLESMSLPDLPSQNIVIIKRDLREWKSEMLRPLQGVVGDLYTV